MAPRSSHPPVVVHREDVIERNKDGSEPDESSAKAIRSSSAIVARFAGGLSDAIGDEAGSLIAPIKERPDFEHLEAKGISVLRKIAARQRKRKDGSS